MTPRVIPWSRRSARIQRVDDDDADEHIINGYLCDAAIRGLLISCPCCGSIYDIKAGDRRSRVFNRERQRFHCGRCRFSGPVYVIVDLGTRAEEEDASAAQQAPRHPAPGQ